MRSMIAGSALAAMIGTAASCSVAEADDPLARYAWRSRVLLVFAPDASNRRFVAQREALAAHGTDLGERSLIVLENVGAGKEADALRQRFDVPPRTFRAVLVGKDGGVKLDSGEPIPPRELFAIIDAMPMRRQKMRER